MKILTYSDLHFEFNKDESFTLPEDLEGDIMILAGDILNFDDPDQLDKLLEFLKPWKNKPVLFVPGNHEYYTDTTNNMEQLRDRFCKLIQERSDIVLLDGSTCSRHGKIAFFGDTMWTDLEDGTKAPLAAKVMSDYRYIRHDDRKLTVDDTMEFHKEYLDRLDAWLFMCEHYPGYKRVVISHHCPIRESGKYEEQSAYVSTKTRAIIENPDSKIDLWVYGHTHAKHDYMIGNTRIISNPYGYPHHDDKDRFDPYGSPVELI